jgi:hypothetical protein
MIVTPVTESEIICIIGALKSKNSSGYNEAANTSLRGCGKFVGKLLAYIFNNLLTQVKNLDHLKYSVVNPLHKKADKFQLSNDNLYRYLQASLRYLKKQYFIGLIRIYSIVRY